MKVKEVFDSPALRLTAEKYGLTVKDLSTGDVTICDKIHAWQFIDEHGDYEVRSLVYFTEKNNKNAVSLQMMIAEADE